MNPLELDFGKEYDIVAMGRASADFVPDRCGRVEEVHNYTKFVGGSPANTAVAAAMQGAKTGFIGKVGDDILGRYVKHFLESKGVDTSHLAVSRESAVRTPVSFTERIAPGVNSAPNGAMFRSNVADLFISPDEIDEDYIARFKILLFSGTSLCRSPAREAVFLAIEYARRHHVRVVFDPDYREVVWNSPWETAVYYWMAARDSDAVLATREEFNAIEYIMLPGNSDDVKTARAFLSMGCRLVCIKHGDKGSRVFTKDGGDYRGEVFPSRVVTLNGAGDSFSGSFLNQMVLGSPVEKALKYAAASAALTVSGRSCASHMPTVRQTEEFIRICESGEIEGFRWWDENSDISDVL